MDGRTTVARISPQTSPGANSAAADWSAWPKRRRGGSTSHDLAPVLARRCPTWLVSPRRVSDFRSYHRTRPCLSSAHSPQVHSVKRKTIAFSPGLRDHGVSCLSLATSQCRIAQRLAGASSHRVSRACTSSLSLCAPPDGGQAPQPPPDPCPFTTWSRAHHAMPEKSRSVSVVHRHSFPGSPENPCGLIRAPAHIWLAFSCFSPQSLDKFGF